VVTGTIEFLMTFHRLGIVAPTDELHHFSEGLFHHQPEVQHPLKIAKIQKRDSKHSLQIGHGFNPCDLTTKGLLRKKSL
jgi:hypothetical protein